MPEALQATEEGVELRVWGGDDGRRWSHVTKQHLREAVHIGQCEVLYAAEKQGSGGCCVQTLNRHVHTHLQLYTGHQVKSSESGVSLSH